jgi:hypothetical protein
MSQRMYIQERLERKLGLILQPLERLFRAKNLEQLLGRLVLIACIVILLVPLVLFPIFFFIYSELGQTFLG